MQTYGICRLAGLTVNNALVTSLAHGFANGDTVVIQGANQTAYNGSYVIANVTTNTFAVTVPTTATS